MNFLEKDLETIIYEATQNPDSRKELEARGFPVDGHFQRQFNLGDYGVADLVEFYMYNNPDNYAYRRQAYITIWELKKDDINMESFNQALSYLRGIQIVCEKLFHNVDIEIKYKIALLGKNIDTRGSFCYLPDFCEDVSLWTYSYGLNGLQIHNRSGYKITNAAMPKMNIKHLIKETILFSK